MPCVCFADKTDRWSCRCTKAAGPCSADLDQSMVCSGKRSLCTMLCTTYCSCVEISQFLLSLESSMKLLSSFTLCLSLASLASAQGSAIPGETPFSSKAGMAAGQINNGGSNILPSKHIEGIVPKSERHRFAWRNGGQHIPLSGQPTKYQQVFDGTELPALLVIRVIAFRQDEVFSNKQGKTIDVEMKLGFTTMNSTTLGNNFAGNFNSGPPNESSCM